MVMTEDSQRRSPEGSATGPSLPYPLASNPQVSKRMRRNRRADTKPEQHVRSVLHGRGRRFRKHLPIRTAGRTVRPDIVFGPARLAVFVDGCFWHCCPEHGTQPGSNTSYWGPKLARNVERDREVNEALVQAGWTVLRGWEHEPPTTLADRIEEVLDAAGSGSERDS